MYGTCPKTTEGQTWFDLTRKRFHWLTTDSEYTSQDLYWTSKELRLIRAYRTHNVGPSFFVLACRKLFEASEEGHVPHDIAGARVSFNLFCSLMVSTYIPHIEIQ